MAVDGASIWSAPSIPSIVLATVKAGTTLEVVAQVGSWYRVRLPADATRTGYILMRLVEGGAQGNAQPPPPRSGQPRRASGRPAKPSHRAYVSFVAAYEPVPLKFSNTVKFTDLQEEGSRTVSYSGARAALPDFGAGVEVSRGIFVGGAVTRFSDSSSADIDEQVPHPFFFNQPRTLKATVSDLPREETAVHVQVSGVTQISRRLHVVFGLGPSFFKLRQTLVTDVSYTQEYPYDSVTFQNALTEQQEKTRVGGNVQGDIVWLLGPHVGVDGLIRFSYASMMFNATDGKTFTARAGGLHVGIGLRAEF